MSNLINEGALKRVISLAKEPLFRSSFLSFLGLISRALVQFLYFIVVSKSLGVEQYGVLSAGLSACLLLFPLSGWGVSNILSKRISQTAAVNGVVPFLVLRLLATSIPLFALVLGYFALLGSDLKIIEILLLLLSELVFLAIMQNVNVILMASKKPALAAASVNVIPIIRLVLVSLLWAMELINLFNVISVNFIGSILGFLCGFGMLYQCFGGLAFQVSKREVGSPFLGGSYAVGNWIGKSYQELDKLLIYALIGAGALGNYMIAFRLVSVFTLPVTALMSAALPAFHEVQSTNAWWRSVKRVALVVILYSLLASLVSIVAVTFVIDHFFEQYRSAGSYVFLMAIWLLFYGARQLGGVAMVTIGRERTRMSIEVIGALLLLALGGMLVGAYGGLGVALALVLSEFSVAVFLWLYLFGVARKKVHTSGESA
ncbi:oligosaccharide flippase family protein [uncultured Gilvimarinus sp.]|uniref:lipopolysaccharide biosynthesis protein n=1 Tax=uncultured Gilvimarinus sp. TaxID=1689143 RepID=UPI0030DAEB61